jgi:hypothetical protein
LLLFEKQEKMSIIILVIFSIISLQILVCDAYLINMLNFKAMNTRRNRENEYKMMKIIGDFIKTGYSHNESTQNDLEMVSWLIGIFKMKINKRIKEENTVYWYSRQG